MKTSTLRQIVIFLATLPLVPSLFAQEISDLDRERGQTMLRVIRKDIEKHFYDSTYKGIDLDALFSRGAHRIEVVKSNNELFAVVADVLNEFEEPWSTFFVPPTRTTSVEYGWTYQMIGDSCYVTGVKPGSDAEAKGLRVGDRILAIGRDRPTRKNDYSMRALLMMLNPQPGMKVTAQTGQNPPRDVVALAEMKTRKKVTDLSLELGDADYWDFVREWETYSSLRRHHNHDLDKNIYIWKMTNLGFNAMKEIKDGIGDTQDKKALILDVRGTTGGHPKTLDYLISRLFDHEINVGHLESRSERKDWLVEASSKTPFRGLLVILVDSRTAGAAEVLARLVQVEQRGIVIGDTTVGAIWKARSIIHDVGIGTSIFYTVGVTVERVFMSDGGTLEGIGVVPDDIKLPSWSDLANGRDPVLSYAAWLVGGKLSPEEAGKLFPVEWKK